MDHILCIHSAVDGHSGSSYLGYHENAAENIHGQGFVFSVPLGNTQDLELLKSHNESLFFKWQG